MKLLGVILAAMLALIQYPLWLGQGSWLRVWELDRQLGLQQEVNAGKRMRNEGLEAEAKRVEGAVEKALADGILGGDLGGKAGTREIGDAVLARL